MAKFTKISFALIFALILIMMFIVESRPTPTGKSAVEIQNKPRDNAYFEKKEALTGQMMTINNSKPYLTLI